MFDHVYLTQSYAKLEKKIPMSFEQVWTKNHTCQITYHSGVNKKEYAHTTSAINMTQSLTEPPVRVMRELTDP